MKLFVHGLPLGHDYTVRELVEKRERYKKSRRGESLSHQVPISFLPFSPEKEGLPAVGDQREWNDQDERTVAVVRIGRRVRVGERRGMEEEGSGK